MFNLFKKKKEKSSINSGSIFPSAKDTVEKTAKNWKTIKPKEILDKINYESSRGNREAKFYDSYISDDLVKELRSQGYRVEVHASPDTIGPYFKVYW